MQPHGAAREIKITKTTKVNLLETCISEPDLMAGHLIFSYIFQLLSFDGE